MPGYRASDIGFKTARWLVIVSVFAFIALFIRANGPAPNTDVPAEDPPGDEHRDFGEFRARRDRMVLQQIQERGIQDPNVHRAMKRVPRHAFVPAAYRDRAYDDYPLPIGHGQTISQPYIVAFMTEALALGPNDVVLEIGTGSGYQAAVCGEIVQQVYSIEIVAALAKTASRHLERLGYENVTVKAGDGFFGWKEHAPYDAIIGTAAATHPPAALLEQLKEHGRMILPVENEQGFQSLLLITKDAQGELHKKKVLPVRFVPMIGQVRESGRGTGPR